MITATLHKEGAVADKHFEVDLPEEVVAGFGWQETEVPQRLRESLVMELLHRDTLSEAQAAELLGLNRWELLDMMGQYHVAAIRMKPEEMRRELTQEL
jgi:hypothetical protein